MKNIDLAHRPHFGNDEWLNQIRRYQEIAYHYITSMYEDKVYKNILDVGASEGYLSNYFFSHYYGVDISPIGDKVVKGTIFEVDKLFPGRRFDLIIYEHVIEHVENPMIELKAARALMNPGAFLFIATPHATNVLAWEPDSHLYLYNEVTIERLLNKAGFTVLEHFIIEFKKDDKELWLLAKKDEER